MSSDLGDVSGGGRNESRSGSRDEGRDEAVYGRDWRHVLPSGTRRREQGRTIETEVGVRERRNRHLWDEDSGRRSARRERAESTPSRVVWCYFCEKSGERRGDGIVALCEECWEQHKDAWRSRQRR